MKHIPTLTLTALAAAASAQTAPAPAAKQELSYNRVIVSTISFADSSDDGITVQGQAKLGAALGGTLYVSAITANLENVPSPFTLSDASLGYAYTLPAVYGISSDLNVELSAHNLTVGVRALVGFGLELGVSFTGANEASLVNLDSNDAVTISASYSLGQFVKGLSIHASQAAYTGASGDTVTSIGVGYNF